LRFYEKHLGGKITMMMTQGEQPNAKDVPPDQKDAILYARMNIGETDLMGSDVPSERFSDNAQRLSLPLCEHHRRSRAYFCSAFRCGEIFMPMQETFCAHRFAMLRDKFGTSWMIINERTPQQS
jgi:PhnB protein